MLARSSSRAVSGSACSRKTAISCAGTGSAAGIARWLRQVTEGVIQLEDGSLYPALYRMENRGWIRSEWRITENNRRARYYRLTALGRRQLATEMSNWATFAQAVGRVFEFEPAGG